MKNRALYVLIGMALGVVLAAAFAIYAALEPLAYVCTQRTADNESNLITFVSLPDQFVVSGFNSDKKCIVYRLNGITVSGTDTLSVSAAALLPSTSGHSSQFLTNDGSSIFSWATAGSGTVTSVGFASTDLSITGGPITSSGTATFALSATGTPGTYSMITTDSKGRVIAGTNRSQASASRSLNTCFQVSSTRDTLVNYSVDIAATLSLTTGQTGTVFLEISDNSGCSSNTQELGRSVNGNTGTLTIGLNITQNVTGTLTGYVPAGKWIQLRTQNTTGTPTFTYRSGQEIQL